jgi:hypothetical protein
MKLLATCSTCLQQSGSAKNERIPIDLTDDGVLSGHCPIGHDFSMCIQGKKFELLLDVAVATFCDGYGRESVGTATSAYERFLEFYIEVIAAKKGISAENYFAMWKHISNQSERQFGAFLALFTNETGTPPIVLEPKYVELRNRVIHKGYIPTEKEAYEYLERIFDFIAPILSRVKETMYEAMMLVVRRELFQRHASARTSQANPIATVAMSTVFSTAHALSADKKNFATALENFRRTRNIFYR